MGINLQPFVLTKRVSLQEFRSMYEDCRAPADHVATAVRKAFRLTSPQHRLYDSHYAHPSVLPQHIAVLTPEARAIIQCGFCKERRLEFSSC
jgi:hypothetical protein